MLTTPRSSSTPRHAFRCLVPVVVYVALLLSTCTKCALSSAVDDVDVDAPSSSDTSRTGTTKSEAPPPPTQQQQQQQQQTLTTSGIISDESSYFLSSSASHQRTIREGLHFLVLGDWGGREWWPYSTLAQVRTAVGMSSVASSHNSSFILALGDNFYSHGQATPRRFAATFERVYHQKSLKVPWYVTAGNHDHLGNVSAQLAYHDVDSRWNYPSLFHTMKAKFGVGGFGGGVNDDSATMRSIQIILIDTVVLAGMHQLSSPSQSGYFDPLPGPASPIEANMHLRWIEHHLEKSTADYLFVAGHYPVYSACSHGNTDYLINNLEPLLKKYDVTAYLSGHEHCALHIERDGMDYILTGTGDECCYEATNIDGLPADADLKYLLSAEHNENNIAGGFASFQVDAYGAGDKMKVVYHDERGRELYSTDLYSRLKTVGDGLMMEEAP